MRYMRRLVLCLAMALTCMVAASAKEVYLYDMKWGSQGAGNGQFQGNIGLSITGNRLYTTECDGYRVQIFDLNGNYINKFGSYGTGSGLFWSPRQVVVDSALNFFVADSENDRVSVFNSTYLPINGFGSDGSGDQNFKNPWRLALNDTTDMLYIADLHNHRISQWTTGGAFVRTFGTLGTGNGQFDHPGGIAVDAAGSVYVGDQGNHRIQKFAGDGTYLTQWNIGTFSSYTEIGGVAAMPGGYLAVGAGIIRKYTATGTPVCEFGQFGTANGQFYGIDGVAADGSSRIFVSDGNAPTCRIQRFVRDYLPTVPTVLRILPKLPINSDNLAAQVSGSTDLDADPVTYRYRWYSSANNITWTNMGRATRVLQAAQTVPGTYYKVMAAGWDGKAMGPWKTSSSVRVLANPSPLTVAAVSAPARGGTIAVTITLSAAAAVQGTLCNLAGMPVANVSSRSLDSGVNSLVLPASSSRGLKLPAGQYLLKLRASAEDGRCATSIVPVVL